MKEMSQNRRLGRMRGGDNGEAVERKRTGENDETNVSKK